MNNTDIDIDELVKKFTTRKTRSGADIIVQDELKPEENATIQSLNSRSAGGFIKNLYIIARDGLKNIIKKFYSNYGHKSIADCGSTTAATDNISMLAAKNMQHWWSYNGQETSTRYIDVTGLGYVDPIGTSTSKTIMEKWFDFYIKSIEPLMEHLKIMRPIKTDEPLEKYNTMIEKRAYDILGSFIPAGARTNVSCHMNLRQWDEKLSYMVHHPLTEISDLGKGLLDAMQERYPSTFVKEKKYEESEKYRQEFEKEFAYVLPDTKWSNVIEAIKEGFHFGVNFQNNLIMQYDYKNLLEKRPIKTEIPKIVNECGSYRIEFMIDFRSHRDLQRQRSALQRVPLLTTKFGFEEWYLQQLPESLFEEAMNLLTEQEEAIALLDCDDNTRQYYIAMGYKVFNTFTVPFADLIYIIELRTPTTVHPTARKVAINMYNTLKNSLEKDGIDFVKIYAETSEDMLDIRRAGQDIFVGGVPFSQIK